MTGITPGIAAALVLAAVLTAAPAQAQNGTLTRAFVSSAGSDGNPCTVTQPCQSFAQAYTKVGANGIIAALDPGKYGPITITGPVTINGNGWAAITAPAQNNGITVNAVSGNVTLTGLEIDGAQAAYNGIVFNSSAGSFTVTDCVVQNMVQDQGGDMNTGNGILLAPTSGTIAIAITDTTVANNAYAGLLYLPPSGSPTVNAVFDRITANANYQGILVDSQNTSGGAISISLTNSIASNNSDFGIYAGSVSEAMGVVIDNVNASSNGGYGIVAQGTANVVLGRSVVTNNSGYGILNGTTSNTFYTYQNNEIYLNGNSNAVGENPLIPVTYQ